MVCLQSGDAIATCTEPNGRDLVLSTEAFIGQDLSLVAVVVAPDLSAITDSVAMASLAEWDGGDVVVGSAGSASSRTYTLESV